MSDNYVFAVRRVNIGPVFAFWPITHTYTEHTRSTHNPPAQFCAVLHFDLRLRRRRRPSVSSLVIRMSCVIYAQHQSTVNTLAHNPYAYTHYALDWAHVSPPPPPVAHHFADVRATRRRAEGVCGGVVSDDARIRVLFTTLAQRGSVVGVCLSCDVFYAFRCAVVASRTPETAPDLTLRESPRAALRDSCVASSVASRRASRCNVNLQIVFATAWICKCVPGAWCAKFSVERSGRRKCHGTEAQRPKTRGEGMGRGVVFGRALRRVYIVSECRFT